MGHAKSFYIRIQVVLLDTWALAREYDVRELREKSEMERVPFLLLIFPRRKKKKKLKSYFPFFPLLKLFDCIVRV